PDGRRIPESVFWQRFAAAQPRILGSLLDAVSAAIGNLPSVRLASVPRMADFAYWVTAAEPALPWEAGKVPEIYPANRDEPVDIVREASAVALPLIDFVTKQGKDGWTGTAKELLAALNDAVTIKPEKRWPSSPQAMAGMLKRLTPALRKSNMEVDFLP